MKFNCTYSDLVNVETVIESPRNPNKHGDRQIELLAKIIDHQGQRAPLVVSKRSGFLVCGAGRLAAIKKLGWDNVAIDIQDFESEAIEYQHMIADNKISILAQHDDAMMIEDLKTLDIDDFELLGMDDFNLPIDPDEAKDAIEDDVPTNVETRCKPGDLWILGEHRLLCGDSTSIDAVDKLMDGDNADITFTSPPYNIGKSIRGEMYSNDKDNKSIDEYTDFLIEWTNVALMNSEYIFHNNQLLESNKKSLILYQNHFVEQMKDILLWNKKQYPPHINKGTFGCKWEYVFVLSNEGKSRSLPCNWQGKFPNVIETENNSRNEYAKTHKAGFPVALPLWVIEKMDFAKSVFDPFGGTGTTLIACEKTKRKCFMMEIDPHYCDVILKRFEDYSGKNATLETPS